MVDFLTAERRKKIGECIAKERKKQGWSQAVLGEKLSSIMNEASTFNQNTVSNWETGKNLPKSINVFLAMSQLFVCDCGYLLGDYEERTHDAMGICKATGLSEESVNTLCSLKTWGADSELAPIIDALVFDYRYATKGEGLAPLAYLINWFLRFSGTEKTAKMVHISGEVLDCNDEKGHLTSALKLDNRAIENAALSEIQQGLISLKKRLARKERVRNGKH